VRTLLLGAREADGVGSHQSDELLRFEAALSKTLDDETASTCLLSVFDRVSFASDISSSHLEDHRWATAVLDSSVSTKLDEVGHGEHRSDVVATLLDFLNLLHSEDDLLARCDSLLVFQHHGS